MQLTVKLKKSTVAVLDVPRVVMGTSIDLRFSTEKESREIFQRLRGIGRCYHVGKNAPKGPYVAIYPQDNKNYNFLIQ